MTTTDNTNNSQNELTEIGDVDGTFDNNGNTTQTLTTGDGGSNQYDAWNRLEGLGGGADYALGYLPNQNVAIRACTGGGMATVSFYTTDMQVLQDDVVSSDDVSSVTKSTAPANQYVWGLGYVNQMVARDDSSADAGLGISGSGLGLRIYPLQDANWNVRTLTGTGGTVLERIDYDNYGNSTVLSATYSPIDTFLGVDTYNWNYGFQGGRYDTSLGVYTSGGRLYAPAIDRWLTQDGGYWDGSNLYQAFDGNPTSGTDPSGTAYMAGAGVAAARAASRAAARQAAINAANTSIIGFVYEIVAVDCDGKTEVYTGSTAREVTDRVTARHPAAKLFQRETTHVYVRPVRANPNDLASGRGTRRSAVNEALRSPEQSVMNSTGNVPGAPGVVNRYNAATPENMDNWAETHSVSLGPREEIPRSKFSLDAGGIIAIIGMLERYSIGTLSRASQNNVSWWTQFKMDVQADVAPPSPNAPMWITPYLGPCPNPNYNPLNRPLA